MDFIPDVTLPEQETGDELCFAFCGERLLVKEVEGKPILPTLRELQTAKLTPLRRQVLGRIAGTAAFSLELAPETVAPPKMIFYDLRQLFGLVDEDVFALAGRAKQVVHWDRTHLYCGHCGTPTELKEGEYAKVCPSCGLTVYPRICPAMMVAVVKENKLLMARNSRRPFKFYSVLAGFVEPGETLEECVRREVREEVGIEVKNIKYFGSQAWPFPHSLMIAFTAEYAGGEIRIDENEITEAGWFGVDELPELPTSRISIARRLIDWFVEHYR